MVWVTPLQLHTQNPLLSLFALLSRPSLIILSRMTVFTGGDFGFCSVLGLGVLGVIPRAGTGIPLSLSLTYDQLWLVI